MRDQYAAQEPLRREKEKEALRNATTNETVPLIEHALDQFKTVPFADERDAHHEDAKWQSKGKSDDLCGYSENGPETLKRTAQNLRQSYGCLKPFKGAVDDLGAAKALMEARAFQDDVIVLLAHWKDDFDDTPPPRFVVEDFLAMLENLRMLHFDHYVVSVVNEKACARLEEAIKEISLDLLPPGSVLSCAYMPNDSALPLTDMATPSVHVCEIASVQPLCAKAKRYMLARILRRVGARVLFLDDDVTLAVNPYPFLNSAVVAKRDVALVAEAETLHRDGTTPGAFVVAGCVGGAGDAVLNELRGALLRFLRPNSELTSYESAHPLYEDLGPQLHARTEIEPSTIVADLVQSAISGHLALCRTQNERHMHGPDEGGGKAKGLWSVREKRCTASEALRNATEALGSPQEAEASAKQMRDALQRSPRAAFGWRGAMMAAPAVSSLARDAGKSTYAAKLGHCTSSDENTEDNENEGLQETQENNRVMLAPRAFLAQAGGNEAALALQWGDLDEKIGHHLCARRLASKVAGFRGSRTFVPGASVYRETKFLALRGEWSRATRRPSFKEYLMDARKLIAMATALGRVAVLPRVPCEGFVGDRVRDGEGADVARMGADKMLDFGAVSGADAKLKTGVSCARHGLAPRAHWPVAFSTPEMEKVPGNADELRQPVVVGCDHHAAGRDGTSSRHATLDLHESETRAEGSTHCELVTGCLCHQGSEAAVAYEVDLQAFLANDHGRFHEDGNATTEVIHVGTDELDLAVLDRELDQRRDSVGYTNADGSSLLPPLRDVHVVYLEPSAFNRGGAATNLPRLFNGGELVTKRLKSVYAHQCRSFLLELQWYNVQCQDGNAKECREVAAVDVYDRLTANDEGKDVVLGNRPRLEHSVGLIARGREVGR